MSVNLVNLLAGLIARFDITGLSSLFEKVAGNIDKKTRIKAMELRVMKILWEHSISHGICASQEQIWKLGIYPKVQDSDEIQRELNNVKEMLFVFKDTDEIDLIAFSKAIHHIEIQLEKHKGQSNFPTYINRIRRVEAGPGLINTIFSFLALLLFGFFSANLGFVRESDFLIAFGIIAIIVSFWLLIRYSMKRKLRGIHTGSGFWTAVRFFILIVSGVALIWISWTYYTSHQEERITNYLSDHVVESALNQDEKFHELTGQVSPGHILTDASRMLVQHEVILLQKYENFSLDLFESIYLGFLGAAAIVYAFMQPFDYFKRKKLILIQAEKELDLADEEAKSKAFELLTPRPRDIV